MQEDGLKFKVNLSDYLDTGLFLDHRITRHMVREESAGKHVLNLFCYTGSFSVYAAAGGAASVTSADLSKTYLKWAEDNMELNGIYDPARHHYVHADVLQYLDELKINTFDLVVMDPPTFSNSKRMKDFLDIQRDHVTLINKVLMAMKKDGVLYFSNNLRRFELDEPAIEASSIKNITAQTIPFDFQGSCNGTASGSSNNRLCSRPSYWFICLSLSSSAAGPHGGSKVPATSSWPVVACRWASAPA